MPESSQDSRNNLMLWLSILNNNLSLWSPWFCRGVTAHLCRRALSGFAKRSASQTARVQGFTALPLSIPHALAPAGALQLFAACPDEGHRGLLFLSLLFHCLEALPLAHARRLPHLPRSCVACADRGHPKPCICPPRTSSVGQRPQQRQAALTLR